MSTVKRCSTLLYTFKKWNVITLLYCTIFMKNIYQMKEICM